jgi:hypothetical protein
MSFDKHSSFADLTQHSQYAFKFELRRQLQRLHVNRLNDCQEGSCVLRVAIGQGCLHQVYISTDGAYRLKAFLAVRRDLHPAIQYALLSAAAEIHAEPGIFQRAGQFPTAERISLPLSDEAQRFHKSGRPFLQHHFPLWMAVLIERLLVILIPIVGLVYPLLRFVPALYDWSMRSKVFRLYGEKRFVELQIERGGAEGDLDATTAQLDRIEQRANQLRMPKAYASMVYSLLGHIALVRQRLKTSQSSQLISS